ncbi:MAG: diguanylate cyclase [Candidatus Thiodiazotropha sp.]|jgi:diguanylate cyclase
MSDSDWKSRYEELLRVHENEHAANSELEEILTRTIIRLTIAASGLDMRLEPHLKSVRNAVRGDKSDKFKDNLNALSDGLLHFAEENPDAARQDNSKAYLRLLSPLKLSKKELSEAVALLGELRDAPAEMRDDQFSRLAQLLGQCFHATSERKAGLFGRLLGGAGGADGAEGGTPKPNDILLNLLEQASWPGHWGEGISGFKERLVGKVSGDAWSSVLQDLLDLSAKSYGKVQMEVKEAEDFLAELTRRLQDLGAHLKSAHEGRDQIVKFGKKMSDQVNSHVGDLGTSVEQATDLQQLKSTVSDRLTQIQNVMDDFLIEERRWHEKTEQRENALKERLEQIESESTELRSRMLEAHHLALLDAVTGLPNRLAYNERAEQELARWNRFQEVFCVLVWDIDDFKSINDRFGHQAGDKALKIIAQSLKSRLRVTDFIARYGGEEFVCLLCGTPGDEALSVAEEMRISVERNGFHSAGKPVNVTISCGITAFQEGDTIENAFVRADKALYAAKKSGKNRCVLA